MKHLYFIRTINEDFSLIYEQKTDIQIYADVEGYKYLVDSLRKAQTANKNTRLLNLNFNSNTMRAMIVQAASSPAKRPRLKFLERRIYINGKPEMELIILGNKPGYDFLISIIQDRASYKKEDLTSHVHLDDDYDKEVVKRSVALMICNPLIKWDENKLFPSYRDFLYNPEKKCLPATINENEDGPAPYEQIEPFYKGMSLKKD